MDAAKLPDFRQRAVVRLVECHSEVVFAIDRLTGSPATLATGLAQGCPLSCILYVLAVDAMLEYTSKLRSVDLVVGFCDDWSLECESIRVIKEVQRAVRHKRNRLRGQAKKVVKNNLEDTTLGIGGKGRYIPLPTLLRVLLLLPRPTPLHHYLPTTHPIPFPATTLWRLGLSSLLVVARGNTPLEALTQTIQRPNSATDVRPLEPPIVHAGNSTVQSLYSSSSWSQATCVT